MINIVILADKAQLPVYKYNLQADDMTILHSTDSLSDAEGYINKANVILLDVDTDIAKIYIQELKAKKVPILVVVDSATIGFTMMEWGATEMQMRLPNQPPHYFCKLVALKVRSVSKKIGGQASRILKRPSLAKSDKLIVIGSSTGGTDTVEYILRQLPEDIPPILIVQHMPPIFTRMYAERLHGICRVSCWEARDGDPLKQGLVLIAPGDQHMILAKSGNSYIVKCIDGDRVCNQRPAADVLFESVATVLGNDCKKCLGIILTGMGSDGARGLLSLYNAGATTIGQDKESSVVYGMPRAAFECGAVTRQLHLNDIAPAILNFVKG